MDMYEYSSIFKSLIAKERNAEINFHNNEIKNLKSSIREKKGRALTEMVRQGNAKLEHDSIFRFVKLNSQKLQPNEFSIGGNVLISTGKPLENALNGTVRSKGPFYIDVFIPQQSNILYAQNIQIDVFVNDTTYTIQNKIIDSMKNWTFRKGDMRDIILHNSKPKLGKPVEINFFNDDLNPSQKLAVNYSMREEDFYMIQGPPGTGKTKTSIEIIRQHLLAGKSVLVAADSNMAVDNIMLGLIKHCNVIRIGESPKIMDEIQHHTLSQVIQRNVKWKIVQDGIDKVQELRTSQREHLIANKKNSKGLSHFQICKLASRGQSDFGINLKDMQSMAKWIVAQDRIKKIQTSIDKIKSEIINQSIKSASVICTTNTNANNQFLDKIDFDLVLIDEAGQSTEPSCLIPISKSKKVILVGDHKQLPPTILSPEAKDLSQSMFERMMNNSRFTLLDTQYRMNPLINEFPSTEFYNGHLRSDGSTIDNDLEQNIFKKPVAFIECPGSEIKKKGATSYYNLDECDAVAKLVVHLGKQGQNVDDIGIISPYSGQVRELQDRMPFIEINSIDGFQGREKNIIIISLVRSNARGSIGFLKDLRRLNVALTRAIKQLIVVGDPTTISNEDTYKRFLDFVKQKGHYMTNVEEIF